jgi:pyridoxamine 5'-phosphate oxidase
VNYFPHNDHLPADPLALFGTWFEEAGSGAPADHTAMTLATSGPDGQPSARMVLLKGFDARGFVFYTNYNSRKARDLARNPRVALTFWWPWIGRQVRIEGTAERTTAGEARDYFRTRPRGNQISAWASDQSEPLTSRDALVSKARELERQYADRDVPCPPFWGGYRVAPTAIEFWQHRSDRLHDRILYRANGSGVWDIIRLAP